MGCLGSSMKQANELRDLARKRSSVWVITDVAYGALSAEDWAQVFAVSTLARSQGIDMDVVLFAFERLFAKYPKTKVVFVDSGIMAQTDETKLDPRFRGHIREVAGAINRILELKSSDPDALEPFLRELRDLHRRIKGFQFSYFESFAHCFEHSFVNLVGPAVSKQQKDAYRKFVIYLYKALCKDELLRAQQFAERKSSRRGVGISNSQMSK